MYEKVLISPLQQVTDEDYGNFGDYPRRAFDQYTLDLYGPGQYFQGFICTDGGSARVNVSAGRFYNQGVGYVNDAQTTVVDLVTKLPTVLSLWVAIVVNADPGDTDTQPTTFLENVSSRATISKPTSRTNLRYANIGPVVGKPAADPQYPVLPSDVVAVAWVLLDKTGIAKIVRNFGAVAPTTIDHQGRLASLDLWRDQTGIQLDALASNIANISGQLADLPSSALVRSMALDLATVRAQIGLPQNYTFYSRDSFIDATQTDLTNPDILASVHEGVRFPMAAVTDSQIGLLNQYDAGVVTQSQNIFPVYTEETRYNNAIGLEDMVSIAQYNYQDIAYTQSNPSRTRIRVGPYFNSCTNWLEYYAKGASYDALNRILRLSDGELLQVAPDVSDYVVNRGISGLDTHTPIRIRQVWVDENSDVPYPAQSTIAGTASGAVIGQTFLNAQDGYLSRVGFPLGQIGATGDIKVLITECTDSGQPIITKAIASVTIPYAQLKNTYTEAVFSPLVYLQKGKIYAIVLVSVGNHFVWVSTKNRLTNGSFFQSTDGRWAVADLSRDLCFYMTFAQFTSPRTEVQLQPLQLQGGMTGVDILAQMIAPSGCKGTFECQFNGKWTDLTTLTDPNTTPLVGLPPLLPFRFVAQGTADIQPMLGVGSNSRTRTRRPQNVFRHISLPRVPPAPVKTVTVVTRLEWWDANAHTFAVKLRTGAGYATITAPTAVQDAVAPDGNNQAIIRTSVFVLPATVTSYVIDMAGTTNNVVKTFHVASRNDIATNP